MIRFISIFFIIWGLVAQPLVAAMPVGKESDKTQFSDIVTALSTVADGQHGVHQDAADQPPCHEKKVSDSSVEPCQNCNSACIDGLCGGSCLINGVAAIQFSTSNIVLAGSTAIFTTADERINEIPPRIFHPPKI